MAFAELVCAAIQRYRDRENHQQVVLVGHSMGCSIAALLVSSTSPRHDLGTDYTIGIIAISPRSSPFTSSEARTVRRLRWLPVPVFDLIRLIDRRGGLGSASITRMVGEGADDTTRKLQLKFNEQSKSAVFLRFVMGMLPSAIDSSTTMPGQEVWSGIKVPLFLVGGESDRVTSPAEVEQIAKWLTKPAPKDRPAETDELPRPVQQSCDSTLKSVRKDDTMTGDIQVAQYQLSSGSDQGQTEAKLNGRDDATAVFDEQKSTKHAFALKTTVFPAPAAHGLLYATSTVRILAGLIESFLSHHVDERLALGWQLQHMATSGKWDVKNLKKWQSIDQCSGPIAGVFRAMKTMREVDDVHNPREFVKRFSYKALPDGVAIVVDISHESPVYDPKGLEEGGVQYHKFPTVSKLPPTPDEVQHFISLIDQLRQSPILQSSSQDSGQKRLIGIHCHYGFNRTGFFIVCYLVERLHYRVQDAIEEFAEKRRPGIKHQHFVNELSGTDGLKYAASNARMYRSNAFALNSGPDTQHPGDDNEQNYRLPTSGDLIHLDCKSTRPMTIPDQSYGLPMRDGPAIVSASRMERNSGFLHDLHDFEDWRSMAVGDIDVETLTILSKLEIADDDRGTSQHGADGTEEDVEGVLVTARCCRRGMFRDRCRGWVGCLTGFDEGGGESRDRDGVGYGHCQRQRGR
ncbi:hypothetical protein LTR53_002349 [Teratosphaeriaceae sp. CCFEE 6253]|nr:hypothetical protein LTR53_002349 [Teratosphaeriaceae sp. CCFEE 6253]